MGEASDFLGLSDFVAPNALNVYVGVQTGCVFWLVLHFFGNAVAVLLASQSPDSSDALWGSFKTARAYVVQAFTSVLNLVWLYASMLVQFALNNVWLIVIGVLALVASFTITNYQQLLIVLVDSAYENIYVPVLVPVRFFVGLLVLVFDIVVGATNFVGSFVTVTCLHLYQKLTHCSGYFDSIFEGFLHVGLAAAEFYQALGLWLVGQLANPLDLTGAVRHLRYVAYDVTLRVECACPADRGLVSIIQTGLIHANSTIIDTLISEGINFPLSIGQVVLRSLVISAATKRYTPPDTGVVADHFVAAITAWYQVTDQFLANAIEALEMLITQSETGVASVPWQPLPIYSISGTAVISTAEVVRVIARCLVNAPVFFTASKSTVYQLVDATRVFDAQRNFTTALFEKNLGHVYPPVTANFGLAVRDIGNLVIGFEQWLYEFIMRAFVGRDPKITYKFEGAQSLPACRVGGFPENQAGYKNVWATAFDMLSRFDALIATPLVTAGKSFHVAMAPYYSPLGRVVELACDYVAHAVSAVLHKTVYVVYMTVSGQPPSYVCVAQFGHSARTSMDLLIKSLPDLLEFFLDIEQAQGMETAHFNCKETSVHNFIYSGSMKAYYFASKMCNTRYIDNTLTTCDFLNAADCPHYTLAYADFNAGALCSFDVFLATTLHALVRDFRVQVSYMERQYVQFVACIIDVNNHDTCPTGIPSALQSLTQQMAQLSCDAHTVSVQLANVLANVASPLFGFAYNSYKGKTGQVGWSGDRRGTVQQYNKLTTSPQDVLTYLSYRHTVPNSNQLLDNYGCYKLTTEVSCINAVVGTTSILSHQCYWDGLTCVVNSATHLRYQQYPLEAAMSTLIATGLNSGFWTAYGAYLSSARLFKLIDFDMSQSPETAYARFMDNFNTLVSSDIYFFITDIIRLAALSARDLVYGVLEFTRTFVYVFDNTGDPSAPFPKPYQDFETAIMDIVAFLEEILELFIKDALVILIDMGRIVLDIIGIVTQPEKAKKHIIDLGNTFKGMFTHNHTDFLADIGQLFLTMPGFSKICSTILKFIDGVVELTNQIAGLLIGNVNKGIDLLNAFPNDLNLALHSITDGIQNAINAWVAPINAIIEVANAAEDGFNTLGDYFDYWVANIGRRRLLFTPSFLSGLVSLSGGFIFTPSSYTNPCSQPAVVSPPPPQITPELVASVNAFGNIFGRRLHGIDSIHVDIPDLPSYCIKHIPTVPFIPPDLKCTFENSTTPPPEPTICYFDSDCTKTQVNQVDPRPYCKISHQDECTGSWFTNAVSNGQNWNDLFAKPCACEDLKDHQFFCNYATNRCESGITPFADPIMKCPGTTATAAKTYFKEDTPYYNAICWIVPAYKCKPADGSTLTDGQMKQCVEKLLSDEKSVQGPHLCRDFCSPDAFNVDNRVYSHPRFGCTCAVGWAVGQGYDSPAFDFLGPMSQRRKLLTEPTATVTSLFSPTGRGGLLGEYFAADWTRAAWTTKFSALPSAGGGVTACHEDSQCEDSSALCRGASAFADNATLSCSSCPLRNFYTSRTGHACVNARCVCTAPDSTLVQIDYSHIKWYGQSKCAMLGKAYNDAHRQGKNITVLEYVVLRDCANRHYAGVALGHLLNMPSLLPAVVYDKLELLRTVAHIGFGSVVYAFLANTSDAAVWDTFNEFKIDPALAMPVVRRVATIAKATVATFPRAVNVTANTARLGVGFVGALIRAPTPASLWNSTQYLMNTTAVILKHQSWLNVTANSTATAVKAVVAHALDDYLARDTMNEMLSFDSKVYTQRFEQALHGAAGKGRRLLTVVAPLATVSCPVATTAVADLLSCASVAVSHYKYNLPRATCQFLNAADEVGASKCPKPSWEQPKVVLKAPSYVANAATSPPPSPSPPLFARPPPSSVVPRSVLNVVKLKRGDVIQNGLLSLLSKVTGVDVRVQVERALTWLVRDAPHAVVDGVQTAGASYFYCDYDESAMCRRRNPDFTFPQAVVATLVGYFVLQYAVNYIGLTFVSSIVATLFVLLFLAIVENIAYNTPYGCSLRGVVPVCLAEDLRHLALGAMPTHLPWPAPLVNTHKRSSTTQRSVTGKLTAIHYLRVSDVVDCTKLGFTDGTRVLIYGLDYLAPTWRSYLTGTTTSTLFGIKAADTFNFFQDADIHGDLYKQCAALNVVSVLPLLIGAFVILAFGVAVVHCALVFVRYWLLAVRELFTALARAYIDVRDSG